jgi:hypothetical protein
LDLLMRRFLAVAVGATICSGVFAQGKLMQVDPRADSWNFDYGAPISPALARLIRSGYVRQATHREVIRLQAVAETLPYPMFADQPVFVLKKRVPPLILAQFAGGYSVNFIVPATLRHHYLGIRPGSNLFDVAGRCLGGPACDPVPSAPPAPPPRPRR